MKTTKHETVQQSATRRGFTWAAPKESTIDLTTVTGYRTNEDGTQTLAWQPREDGTIECVHEAPNCCVGCFEADERLYRNYMGDVIDGRKS